MLDLKFIRENPGTVRHAIEVKGVDLDLDELLRVDRELVELRQRVEALQTVPEAHTPTEEDRHLHEVQRVDQVGEEEVAHHRRAAADAHVELARAHRVIPVVRRLLADDETPVGVYRKLAAGKPGTFLLESAENGRSWSRWSFVGGRSAAALTAVDGELVTFDSPTVFHRDGVRIDSTSTLRFRSREAIEASIAEAGLELVDVRDAPDRPGREHVFLARRPA